MGARVEYCNFNKTREVSVPTLKQTLFIVVWAVGSWTLVRTGASWAAFDWWQDFAVESAYEYPGSLNPTHWWAFPALLLGMYIVPWTPQVLLAAFLGMISWAWEKEPDPPSLHGKPTGFDRAFHSRDGYGPTPEIDDDR